MRRALTSWLFDVMSTSSWSGVGTSALYPASSSVPSGTGDCRKAGRDTSATTRCQAASSPSASATSASRHPAAVSGRVPPACRATDIAASCTRKLCHACCWCACSASKLRMSSCVSRCRTCGREAPCTVSSGRRIRRSGSSSSECFMVRGRAVRRGTCGGGQGDVLRRSAQRYNVAAEERTSRIRKHAEHLVQ
jgi:hypothetical protein